MTDRPEDRFSGHESFVCRYGWLPKVYRAVLQDRTILDKELEAMHTLGIGRNMVKSIKFWGESSGIIRPGEDVGHDHGPLGRLLMGPDGWDPYLERLESLWLIHWWLVSDAKLGAWSAVFGNGRLRRFDRKTLVDRLGVRGRDKTRPLASSTLEQHAGILLQSYVKDERSNDDTSWCPLQDLSLLMQTVTDDGRVAFNVLNRQPLGLTERAFAVCLLDFVRRRSADQANLALSDVSRGDFAPGTVLCIDELTIRRYLDELANGLLAGCLRFNDTADTQSIVVNLNNAPNHLILATDAEVSNV